MNKLVDLTGKRFGKLIVVERAENAPNGVAIWKCKCDCGNIAFVRGGNLKSGGVKSCGCLRHVPKDTHHESATRLYRIWAGIKSRCVYNGNDRYKDYGGRGIKMCDEWVNSYENFRDWALSNGYKEGLTIERIDVNGNYCPKNCTWIPKCEQAKNRRSCYAIEYNGKTQNLTDWCNELGLNYKRVHDRMYRHNWDFERAAFEPVHVEKRNKSKEGD